MKLILMSSLEPMELVKNDYFQRAVAAEEDLARTKSNVAAISKEREDLCERMHIMAELSELASKQIGGEAGGTR